MKANKAQLAGCKRAIAEINIQLSIFYNLVLHEMFYLLPELKNITLIAVSKKQSIDKIKWAISEGITSFGENYLQEAIPKIDYFKKQKNISPVEWHFIGTLQSNKTKLVANYFDWVQSVNNKNIAKRLNDQRDPALKPLNICIQINESQKSQQSGIKLEELPELMEWIHTLPHLKLRGLMTIVTKDYEKVGQTFYNLKQQGYDIDTLSMGMSQDYPLAIEKGANMIRLGTLIFGERK